MKVICIENDLECIQGHKNFPNILVGEAYEVINEVIEMDGFLYYELAEFFNQTDEWLWDARCFIPLSNIDETEIYSQPEKILEVQ